MPVGDQIRQLRQRSQGGPVPFGADGDDFPAGAVDLPASDQQPLTERAVKLGQAVEAPAGQDVFPHDQHLPLNTSLPGGAVGGKGVDEEAVMLGERRGLRVQRDGLARCDVPLDDGLGPVVDDRAWDTPEVRERPAVAVPERREVQRT